MDILGVYTLFIKIVNHYFDIIDTPLIFIKMQDSCSWFSTGLNVYGIRGIILKMEMGMKFLIILCMVFIVTGCDTLSGVSRSAQINKLPDIPAIAKHINNYPEIDKAYIKSRNGSRPITSDGVKKSDKLYYIFYYGGTNIKGNILFLENYKGEVYYSQSLTVMNRKCPPEWIKATVPIMEKIERDLKTDFNVKTLSKSVKVKYIDCQPPDPPKK